MPSKYGQGALLAASLGSVATMPVQGKQPNMTLPHNLHGATANRVPTMHINHTQLTHPANQTSRHNQTHSTGHNDHEHQHEPHELHTHNHGHNKTARRRQHANQNKKVRNNQKRIAEINKMRSKSAKGHTARARGVSKKSRKRKRAENNKRQVKKRKTKRK